MNSYYDLAITEDVSVLQRFFYIEYEIVMRYTRERKQVAKTLIKDNDMLPRLTEMLDLIKDTKKELGAATVTGIYEFKTKEEFQSL